MVKGPLKTSCGLKLGRAVRTADRLNRDRGTTEWTFLGRRHSRSSGLGRLLKSVDLLDHDEDHKRDDQKIDHVVQEQPVIQRRGAGSLRFRQRLISSPLEADVQITEINASKQKSDRRHHDIINQRRYDLAERAANDDADRHINHVPPHHERFEFFQYFHTCSFEICFRRDNFLDLP